MGESFSNIRPLFNQSIRIEGRPERLTAEAGALLLPEADERLGFIADLASQIKDTRDPSKSRFSMTELLRTAIMLPAMGWKDQDDADFLRQDRLRYPITEDYPLS